MCREAIKLLRGAWDAVDIFSSTARRYKLITKICFNILLVIGILNTGIVVMSMNATTNGEGNVISEGIGRVLIIAISLFGAGLTSVVTFLNPAAKWLQLRGASLALESEIWKFRTRTAQKTKRKFHTEK